MILINCCVCIAEIQNSAYLDFRHQSASHTHTEEEEEEDELLGIGNCGEE